MTDFGLPPATSVLSDTSAFLFFVLSIFTISLVVSWLLVSISPFFRPPFFMTEPSVFLSLFFLASSCV